MEAIVKVGEEAKTSLITIPVEEYTHLKDTETRFAILKNQMMNAEYCPIHTQIILGIEEAYKEKQAIKKFMDKDFHIPVIPPLAKGENEIKQAQELKTDLMPHEEENA